MDLTAKLTAIVELALERVLDRRLSELHSSAPELMTRSEAAKFLRVSERQLDLLRKNDGLPHLLVGDSPRFERDELMRWTKERAGQ